MIVQDLDTLGYHRVVFWCDTEPSILSLLRAVKLAWTGDVVQETSAEGDPQSNGAAASSANVVKGHVRSIKLAVESASSVEVPADHDLLTWLVPYAASMHRRFAVGPRDTLIFEGQVAVCMRVVCPSGREKDASEASQEDLWKKWAAKHECEELKEGVWLEPSQAVLRRKTHDAWTHAPTCDEEAGRGRRLGADIDGATLVGQTKSQRKIGSGNEESRPLGEGQ